MSALDCTCATVLKFNPYHDLVGRFTEKIGASVPFLTSEGKEKQLPTTIEGASWLAKYRSVDASPHAPGSKSNPIACHNDIEKAARLILAGKHVTLNQPDQVSTLVNKIKSEYDAAVAAGKKGKDLPVWNIAAISVAGTNLFAQENLDIPRVEMPQIGGKVFPGSRADAERLKRNPMKDEVDLTQDFLKELKESGIESKEETRVASHLKATQDELDGAKIGAIANAIAANQVPEKRITVTRDGYVLDGHHRWAGTIVNDLKDNHPGDLTMPVITLDIDIGTALSRAREFQEKWGIKPAELGAKADFSQILKKNSTR